MAYPTNPTTGDTYVLGTKTWTYNGTNWVNQATFASGGAADIAFSDLTSTPTTLAGYGITDGGSSTTINTVGTYAWLGRASGQTTIQHGGTIAGSTLRYAGVGQNSYSPASAAYTTGLVGQMTMQYPAGTWQAMGHCTSNGHPITPSTIFLRIS